MKDDRDPLQLFDLLARCWDLPATATQVCFANDDGAAAFGCADGSIRLALTADKAAPDSRIRRAVDTGRLTIAPRKTPVPPMRVADHTEGRSTPVIAHGPSGFAFGKANGRINTLTPGGTSVYHACRGDGAIDAIASIPGSDDLVFASSTEAHAGGRAIALNGRATCISVAPRGGRAAIGQDGCVSVQDLAPSAGEPEVFAVTGTPDALIWHSDGRRLACCLGADGIALVDTATGAVRHHGSFPIPVTSVVFDAKTDTVVASGAYRVVAWSLNDAPEDGTQPDIKSGRPSLVAIDAIAASPVRSVVAAGYANGLLSLAEIGRPDEIMLRGDTGTGFTAMSWSDNGRWLALASADGAAALVEFPESMFKT